MLAPWQLAQFAHNPMQRSILLALPALCQRDGYCWDAGVHRLQRCVDAGRSAVLPQLVPAGQGL